ncbi:hypothetical protein M0804_013320 [Polistes exclamans]|nr:hypothetical protein M0804_013320 [Polistes exclamans]
MSLPKNPPTSPVNERQSADFLSTQPKPYFNEDIRQCFIKHAANSIVCDGIDRSKPYEHNTVDYVSTIS